MTAAFFVVLAHVFGSLNTCGEADTDTVLHAPSMEFTMTKSCLCGARILLGLMDISYKIKPTQGDRVSMYLSAEKTSLAKRYLRKNEMK